MIKPFAIRQQFGFIFLLLSVTLSWDFNAQANDTATAQIVKVYHLVNGIQSNEVGLGDWLTVEVSGLSIQQQAIATQAKSKLVLFLGDIPIKGLCTDAFVATNTGNAEFRFYLQRTDSLRADWAALLGHPSHFSLPFHISVGFDDGYKLPALSENIDTINFIVVRKGWFISCLFFTFLLIIVVYVIAAKTNALRDDGPDPAAGTYRTYSLARCQMAFWFVLVLPTFVYLWLITGSLDTLTSSILVLMGISSGTAVFAHAQAKVVTVSASSTGFINDALKDNGGSISFHHFQMFVWTIVLGCIFIAEVWRNLAMPEFSDTLLGLMGISSGTYLGTMLTQQPVSNQTQPNQAPAPINKN